ncbi:hypothetical protein [Virgibacillus sp. L01]|uniref:hypothetical protein n=1 Tax=Virgibacillus sp. L01 TaxID=3457429 RepID=UPI003FD384C3
MNKIVGVMTCLSAISSLLVGYEIAIMNTLMPSITGSGYYYFIISSIVFLLGAIVINKGLNKWIKIVMYSYLGLVIIYILAIIGIYVAMLGGI